MSHRPWKNEEYADLLSRLRRSTRLQDALIEHNRVWKSGRTYDSVIQTVRRRGGGCIQDYLRPVPHTSVASEPDLLKKLLGIITRRKSASLAELCNEMDLSPKHVEMLVKLAREKDYQISMPTDDRIALTLQAPAIDRLAVRRLPIEPIQGHIRIAAAGDLHFGSKMHRGECLRDFIDLAYDDYGVRTVFVPGDVFAGINMYPGQLNEVETWAMEGQVKLVVDGLPRKPGLSYETIGGNHDESYTKASGANVLKTVASLRPDVKYHGFYSALFDLVVPDSRVPIKMELHHPDKAGSYAITYHLQKEIEQIPSGMKPQVLLMGHTHQAAMLPDYRGVAALYCGCFEDQTLFLKRKHINPHIGGWILDLGVSAGGTLRSLTMTWVRYYHSRRGPIRDKDARFERSIGVPVG